jgi:hypothetical protein
VLGVLSVPACVCVRARICTAEVPVRISRCTPFPCQNRDRSSEPRSPASARNRSPPQRHRPPSRSFRIWSKRRRSPHQQQQTQTQQQEKQQQQQGLPTKAPPPPTMRPSTTCGAASPSPRRPRTPRRTAARRPATAAAACSCGSARSTRWGYMVWVWCVGVGVYVMCVGRTPADNDLNVIGLELPPRPRFCTRDRAQASEVQDPWAGRRIDKLPLEHCRRHRFNPAEGKWVIDDVLVGALARWGGGRVGLAGAASAGARPASLFLKSPSKSRLTNRPHLQSNRSGASRSPLRRARCGCATG